MGLMDTLSKIERSERMALVRGKDTTPELLVRRTVHALGYRYRLHSRRLPGKPDLVFRKRNKIIFVHGCFWHRHAAKSCKLARLPKSRLDFWRPKLELNRLRDAKNLSALRRDGWQVLVIWECELTDKIELRRKLKSFLGRK
jgi:DNA mismatch endonuclease (patch repair protein)